MPEQLASRREKARFSERSREISRGAFLTVGSLGLTLPSLLADDPASLTTAKSVVFLRQQGGPSQ